ncbi:hypothetical protein [Staphylococcus schleiferi]|uniref:hypothetical protein n=1 Tax=Staphylococcus schleiferi TaxID=1295 RepID=UPI0024804C75|nr:hypothetical protein [Staphylococcus schleiferi]
MTKKLICIVLLFILLPFSFMTFFLFFNNQSENSDLKMVRASASQPLVLNGIVQSDYQKVIVNQTTLGEVKKIEVVDGQSVKINDPLLTYHNAAKAHQIKFLSHLIQQNRNPSNTLNYRAQIAQLQEQQNTTIKSPFEGIVHLHKHFPSFQNEKILEVYSKKQHLSFIVPENLYTKIKVNQPVSVKKVFDTKTYKGTVTSISSVPTTSDNSSSFSTYSFNVKTAENFPIGTHFTLQIEQSRIVLPQDTLFDRNSVVINKNGKFIKRIINYDRINEQLLIDKGVFIGEKVVRNPNANILEPS